MGNKYRKIEQLSNKLSSSQMSESILLMALLTFSGGFQDAYTYWGRGYVFANAQTGNFVLMTGYAFSGKWLEALTYLIPIVSFAIGIVVAELIRQKLKNWQLAHWRQLVLGIEVALLLLVGLMPGKLDFEANALVSLSCALQVQAFRHFAGCTYASTMCIGNLRSAMENLGQWIINRKSSAIKKSLQYLMVLFFFATGAGMGSVLTHHLGLKAIWVSCFLLLVCILLMNKENGSSKEEDPL